MHLRTTAIALALGGLLLVGLPGCMDKNIYEWTGWTTTVEEADTDTAEGVIQDAIEAAMTGKKDQEAGWKKFKALLHSRQKSRGSLSSWKANNFPSMIRKVDYYLVDDSTSTFEIAYAEEAGRHFVVFVVNERSDMPTPCKLLPDPEAGGAYRIDICSL